MSFLANMMSLLPGRAPVQMTITPTSPKDREQANHVSTHRRLSQLCNDCIEGRLAAAELELTDWARQDSCPADAHLLLASIMAQRGLYEQALHQLQRPELISTPQDVRTTQSLIALLVSNDLRVTARNVLTQLQSEHGHDQETADWIAAMQMPGSNSLPSTSDALAEQLADELSADLNVIPSLVAAQHIAPELNEIALLRHAMMQILPDIAEDNEQRHAFCVALAQLAMLASDTDDARRWAHQGLRANPFSAPLALVLSKVDDDDAVGPPAASVLSRVSRAFPHYPDLRAAMIRRYQQEGDTKQANMQLQQWLEDQPDNPIATKLAKELVA